MSVILVSYYILELLSQTHRSVTGLSAVEKTCASWSGMIIQGHPLPSVLEQSTKLSFTKEQASTKCQAVKEMLINAYIYSKNSLQSMGLPHVTSEAAIFIFKWTKAKHPCPSYSQSFLASSMMSIEQRPNEHQDRKGDYVIQPPKLCKREHCKAPSRLASVSFIILILTTHAFAKAGKCRLHADD